MCRTDKDPAMQEAIAVNHTIVTNVNSMHVMTVLI